MTHQKSFGFVADPLIRFNVEAETSLFLMREIQKRGGRIFVCEPKDLFLKQNRPWAFVQEIVITKEKRKFYQIVRQVPLDLSFLDCLFLRKDPPFDLAYLHHLYLLQKLEGKVLMINEPSAIMECNEKLSALEFPFAPKTLVSSRKDIILPWAKKFRDGVVLKPLHYGGGTGIRWFKKIDERTNVRTYERTILRMTDGGANPIVAQEYLPAAKKGDKRILLWNGKLLGTFLRKPKPGEFRANLHQGGRFVKCPLTAHDKKIIQKVGPWAKLKGLYFVGLDVIGRYLTEINVTSPMGIREVNVLYDWHVERHMINDILKWI